MRAAAPLWAVLAAGLAAGACSDRTSRLFVSPSGEIPPAVRRQLELPSFKRGMVEFVRKLIPGSDRPNGSLERPYRRIQEAVDAVPELKRSLLYGGGEVLIDLTPGRYAETVTVREDDVRIEGIFSKTTVWGSPIIEGDEVSIRVEKARKVTIASIHFAESVRAVAVRDSSLVVVTDCIFENFREAAVSIENTDSFKFLNNVVRKPAASGASKGLQADLRGSYAKVAGNRIADVESIAILLEAGAEPELGAVPKGGKPRPLELLVEDNVVSGARSHGLMIEAPRPDRTLRASVRRNEIRGVGGYGIGCGEGVEFGAEGNTIQDAGLGDLMPGCGVTQLPPTEEAPAPD